MSPLLEQREPSLSQGSASPSPSRHGKGEFQGSGSLAVAGKKLKALCCYLHRPATETEARQTTQRHLKQPPRCYR